MLEKSCGWWLIWYFLFFCHGGAEATESRPYIDPDITQSSKVMSPQGQPLVINCGIDGFPKPLITWYKSLEVMAPDNRVSVLSNGSLHFMRLTTGDQGYYYCDGKNYLGQVKSAKIFVEVAYINPHFEQEPDSQYIRGKSRTLPCSPPASHPPANVTWYKDNQPMKYRTGEHAAYILDPAKSIWDLFFTDIQKQDEGRYFCIASNNFAVPMSRTSNSADVQIEGQLQWVVKEKVTDHGQNLTLFCPVENCCSKHQAGWFVGGKSKILDVKTFSNDPNSKYHGTYNKDGFGFVIRNLSEADLNVTYHCNYGFNESTPTLLLYGDVFKERGNTPKNVPDKDKDKENNTVTIVLSIVGSIVVAGIVVGAIIIVCRRKNKKQKSEDSSSNPDEIPLLEDVALYCGCVNFTGISYTKELNDRNSNTFKNLAENLEKELTELFVSVPGEQVVVIKQFEQGSLLTTFDLTSQGYYEESVLQETIEKPLRDGRIGSYKASLEGFKFRAFSVIKKKKQTETGSVDENQPMITVCQQEPPTVEVPSHSVITVKKVTLDCTVSSSLPINDVQGERTNDGSKTTITSNTNKYSGSTTTTPSPTIVSASSSDARSDTCSASSNVGTGQSTTTAHSVTENVYRVCVNFTDILYTKQLDDGNSNEFKSLAENLQKELIELFVSVPGKQVVVIVQFKYIEDSLLTIFDLTSWGYDKESVLRETIEKPLRDGRIGNYRASPVGFTFRSLTVVYRVDVTFTDISFPQELDEFKSLAGNIQTDLTKLFLKVPGKQVVIVQFKSGSLLTFDLKSQGYYGESVLRETIEKPLKDGIIGSYKASPAGFDFKAFSGDFHGAIVEKYRTKPKIPKDLLDDKTFLSKLLEECGKNTEGLYTDSSGGIDVYFPATLLVVVMKYRPETEIVKEVLNDMLTTLTSQSPSPVVIVYHRSVKTAMEKVYKDCKKPVDKEDCEKPKDKEDGEKPIVKEDCEKQIEIFRKFIEKHKFDYSASSCLQQCIYKSRQ